jgi:hypothetical protein
VEIVCRVQNAAHDHFFAGYDTCGTKLNVLKYPFMLVQRSRNRNNPKNFRTVQATRWKVTLFNMSPHWPHARDARCEQAPEYAYCETPLTVRHILILCPFYDETCRAFHI